MENTLFAQILDAINTHIDKRVEEKVNQIMESHKTMMLLDENIETRMRVIANEVAGEAIVVHEQDYEHNTEDEIHDIAVNAQQNVDLTSMVERTVNQILQDDDYATKEDASEIAQDKVDDIDWQEKVKEAMQEIMNG
jgi:PHD/YefM family antitoxin component YafN of YafNO toxin-antitoxin module